VETTVAWVDDLVHMFLHAYNIREGNIYMWDVNLL
jgi:hypothetical protein